MVLIILAVIVMIAVFIGLGLGDHEYKYIERKRNYTTNEIEDVEKTSSKFGFKLNKLQLLAPLALLIILFGMFTTVDATEVAVVTRFGEVQEVVNEPGLKVKNPLDKYNKYSTEVQEIRYDNVDHLEISCWASTGQDVFALVTVQYKIDVTNAAQIYEVFGGNIDAVQTKLSSLLIAEVKGTISKYTPDGLIENRAVLSGEIENDIRTQLASGDDPLPVILTAAYLTNINFTITFQDSIDAKVVAEQDLIKAATEKEIAVVQANEALEIQEVLNAQNIAMAIAQATADVTRAEGTSTAQTLLNSVTVNAINTMYIGQFADDIERAAFEASITMITNDNGTPLDLTDDFITQTSDGGFLTIQEVSNIILTQLYYDTWDGILPEVIAGEDGLSLILPSDNE